MGPKLKLTELAVTFFPSGWNELYGVEGGSSHTVTGELLYMEAYSTWDTLVPMALAQLKIYTKQKF